MHTISKVFVDTNAIVALRDELDSTHERAVEIYKFLKSVNSKLYISSDTVAETLTVVSKKLGKESAIQFLREIGNSYREIFIDEVLHNDTRKYFAKVKQKNISFIDCSSVIAMKRNKIKYIFSFDDHFRQMGVSLLEDIVDKK